MNKLFYMCMIMQLFVNINSLYYFSEYNYESIIFIFHGHGDNCAGAGIVRYTGMLSTGGGFKNIICVESGDGNDSVFVPLSTQISNALTHVRATLDLEEYSAKIQNGVFFLGLSQGGIIARMIFNENEDISNVVKRIITVGTPNIGISNLNMFNANYKNSFVNWIVKSSIGQSYSAANFYVGFDQSKIKDNNVDINVRFSYLNCAFDESSIQEFLDKPNNTQEETNAFADYIEKCAIIKSYYDKLDMFATFMFVKDALINPTNSPILGQRIAETDPLFAQNKIEALIESLTSKHNFYTTALNSATQAKNQQLIFNYTQTLKQTEYMINFHNADLDLVKSSIEGMGEDSKFYNPFGFLNSEFYKYDILHIRRLYQNNRYLSCAFNRQHMEFGFGEFEAIIRLLNYPRKIRYKPMESLMAYPNFILPNLIEPLRLYCDFTLINQIVQQTKKPQASTQISMGTKFLI